MSSRAEAAAARCPSAASTTAFSSRPSWASSSRSATGSVSPVAGQGETLWASSSRSATGSVSPVAGQGETLPSQQMAHQFSSFEQLSQGLDDIDDDCGVAVSYQELLGIMKSTPIARWTHEMKLFPIELLKEYDVPGFRIQNAWSKEAWTNIVSRLNQKFCVSFSTNQVKQKEQDLWKDYRTVKDLMAESGFEWDSERMMVEAQPEVWASFAARKNSKDALRWRDKSFPYFDDLVRLYHGRYAKGRTGNSPSPPAMHLG